MLNEFEKTEKKDAFYFPHFSNSRHDRKIKRLRKELGTEGYGIYFMVLEVLREQSDYKFPISDIDLLADEFNVSEAKVRATVCNYGLFEVDPEEKFFSRKFIIFMQPWIQRKEQARLAGIASGEARRAKSLSFEQQFNESSTNDEQMLNNKKKEKKEKKGNESKEDKGELFVFKRESFEYMKNPEFKEWYLAFLEMRKSKKKPPTERAEKDILERLHKNDISIAIEMIKKSTNNNWTDVYPLSDSEKPKKLTYLNA